MATAHTYYVAHRDQCLGERSNDEELCAMLKRLWTRHAEGHEPTIVDGVSAWLDEGGNPQLRIIRAATAQPIDDAAVADRVASHLRA